MGPVAPVGPAGPVAPTGPPAGPVAPVGPVGPGGPRMGELGGAPAPSAKFLKPDPNRRHLDEIVADIPPSADNYRLWHVDGGTFTSVEA